MHTASKDRPALKRRNEDFLRRRNRMGAKLILKQREELKKQREALQDTPLSKMIRAE